MFDPVAFERDYPAELPCEGYERFSAGATEPYPGKDELDVEATHAAADRHGYDLATTPLDKLFANQALGFDTAGAMMYGYSQGNPATQDV